MHNSRDTAAIAPNTVATVILVTLVVVTSSVVLAYGFSAADSMLAEPAQAGVTFLYDGEDVEATVVDTGNVHTLHVRGFQNANAVESDSWNAIDSSTVTLEDPSPGDNFRFQPGDAAESDAELTLVGQTADTENTITTYTVP